MKLDQVAAQLYTLRDHLKTPAQITSTLKKVRKIGYRAVQVSGMGPIDTGELVRILDGEGLICCATHENSDTILDNPEAVAEKLSALSCTYTAYPFPAGVDVSTLRSVRAFAKQLNNSGKILHDAGKVLTYHNHDIEFFRIKDTTVLDIIYNETDAEFVQGEIDTHWVQAGGGSSVKWCRKLKDRLPMLHMKDYAVNIERKRVFAEIGNGNLDWPEIIQAAEESGCAWFIVEQDGDWLDNDPFKSLKRSYQYIKDQLVG